MAIELATDRNFDILTGNGICLVDFYTTHCGPCRSLLPTLLEIEGKLPFVTLVKVNLDHCPELSDRFMIEGTPTIYIGRDGQLAEFHGSLEEEPLSRALAALYYGCDSLSEKKAAESIAARQPEKTVPEAQKTELPKKPIVRYNEDAEVVAAVKAGLRAKDGYCPCRIAKTPENKCMCKEFREQIADPEFEGYCHCMLYYKCYE